MSQPWPHVEDSKPSSANPPPVLCSDFQSIKTSCKHLSRLRRWHLQVPGGRQRPLLPLAPLEGVPKRSLPDHRFNQDLQDQSGGCQGHLHSRATATASPHAQVIKKTSENKSKFSFKKKNPNHTEGSVFTNLQLLTQGPYPALKPTAEPPESCTRSQRLARRAQPRLGRVSPLRRRCYWLLHPAPPNSRFPVITQAEELTGKGEEEEGTSMTRTTTKRENQPFVWLWLQSTKSPSVGRHREAAGNTASGGALPRHPPTYFVGGSREHCEQHWSRTIHSGGLLASFDVVSRSSVARSSAPHSTLRALTGLKRSHQRSPAGDGIFCKSRSRVNPTLER